MKRIASLLSIGFLLTPFACKHEDNAPPLAHSASAPAALASTPVLPQGNGAAPAASDFEGEIALLAKGKFAEDEAKPLELRLQIKGGKVRIELPESLTNARGFGPAYLLVQPQDKKAYAVLESKKQAVLLEFDKLAERAKTFAARSYPGAGASAGKSAGQPARLERTGKSDTVADIKCEIWHYDQGKSAGDACIAERETPWLLFPVDPGQASAELSWVSAVADGRHFPLRFVATEKNVERGRIEVTSIQQKPLPQSSFTLPADYAVVSLEQMMGSMLGGAGLPPGIKLPPGVKLPPGIAVPPELAAPQHRK